MSQRVPPDLLRDMVRELLSEVLDDEVSARAAAEVMPGGDRTPWRETVVITSQGELDRAVRRILADSTDPRLRRAIEQGELSFVLAAPTPPATGGSNTRERSDAGTVHRIERGAVTEKHVRAAAQAGAVIMIAARVVITPLAKDKARSLGVVITKEP